MKNLSKEQLKIIYAVLIVLFFVLLFWIFIYKPQHKKFSNIKKKLILVEDEITEITNITKGVPLTEAVKEMNLKLKKDMLKLPAGEEQLVKVISLKAQELKLEIANISFSGEVDLADKIPGQQIIQEQVSLKITGEYKSIGEFLSWIRKEEPVLMIINSLSINGQGEGQIRLSADIGITAYFSG